MGHDIEDIRLYERVTRMGIRWSQTGRVSDTDLLLQAQLRATGWSLSREDDGRVVLKDPTGVRTRFSRKHQQILLTGGESNTPRE